MSTPSPPPPPPSSPLLTAHTTNTLCSAAKKRPLSKPKRPSYLIQRKERDALTDQVHVLEAQVEELRVRAGLPSRQDTEQVDDIQTQNFDLEEALLHNDLSLARLHSLATNELLVPTVNPMSTFIHLPKDMASRRAILRGMQTLKLRRGIDMATQHLHHLDHLMPYLSEERFTTSTGAYHCHRVEINQFPNFKTARQLYDVFVHFLYHTDVSVTAGLGQLALREDTDDHQADPTIWNHRIVTVADDVGCTEELNSVAFAHFDEYSPVTNSPMGIVVYDTVNVDDLYPYLPHERTSKDVQAAHMVFEMTAPDSDDVVVVLKQCLFCVQLVPQFELAPRALDQLQQNSMRWPVYIIKYLREYVLGRDDEATVNQ